MKHAVGDVQTLVILQILLAKQCGNFCSNEKPLPRWNSSTIQYLHIAVSTFTDSKLHFLLEKAHLGNNSFLAFTNTLLIPLSKHLY